MNFPFEKDAITVVHLSPFFVLYNIYIYIYILKYRIIIKIDQFYNENAN
jgi:hypothetical protein